MWFRRRISWAALVTSTTLFSIWSCSCWDYARFDRCSEEFMSFSIHFRHPNNPTHYSAGSWSCDSGYIPWNHSVFQWTASHMKPASSPFTHTTLYISWGCGSPGGTGVPGTEVAAGTSRNVFARGHSYAEIANPGLVFRN